MQREWFVKFILWVTAKIASLSPRSKTHSLFLLFSIHAVLTFLNKDFTWLAAFGGLLTVLGLLLIFHYSLPENEPLEYEPKNPLQYTDGRPSVTYENSFFAKSITDSEAERINQEYHENAKKYAQYVAKKRINLMSYLALTISGTLIWAYVGFLNFLFKCST